MVIAGAGIAGAHRARARRAPGDPHLERLDEASPRRTYLQFVALTIVNPATVIYFAALILGLPAVGAGSGEKLAFVVGGRPRLARLAAPDRDRPDRCSTTGSRPGRPSVLSLVGYGIVLLIAANIARGLLAG